MPMVVICTAKSLHGRCLTTQSSVHLIADYPLGGAEHGTLIFSPSSLPLSLGPKLGSVA